MKVLAMELDIRIMCSFDLCPNSGKPYYLTDAGKVYGIPEITVPEEFRPFVQQKGVVFHAYTTSRFDPAYSNITEMSVLSFLDGYPEWLDIMIDLHYDAQSGWTKARHLKFKKALAWFAQQDFDYKVKWSM